jgi:sialidase-1
VTTTAVFVSGSEGYHTFRIPSLIVTAKGTLLAFAEGRRNGRGDSGDIDLVLKRSTGGGASWSDLQVVWDDGGNTCGNPCPVIDGMTGVIWLLLTHNLGEDTEEEIIGGRSAGTRTVWVARSDDDGRTWSKPIEITRAVKKPEWTWYATGPGVGIQTRAGRLVVPCDARYDGSRKGSSHIIWSDDHGATWHAGGAVGDTFGESQVVELAGGALLLNMRNLNSPRRERGLALSRDGGATWSPPSWDPALFEPVCQASIVRLPAAAGGREGGLLFANPASRTERAHLTVRLSQDEGKTWPIARELHAGPAAYSCLAVLPDSTIGCLHEAGERHPYERIVCARFRIEWLMEPATAR